jgi:hypothetical protein
MQEIEQYSEVENCLVRKKVLAANQPIPFSKK